eukprot:jgi/Botrbrau1/6545/Bobra.40_2s0016.1
MQATNQVAPSACGGPGKKVRKSRKQHLPFVEEHWDEVLNSGTSLEDLGSCDDSQQCYFFCECRQHRVFIFRRTLRKEGIKALQCKFCEEKWKSELEQLFWGACDRLSDQFPLVWLVEVRVLRGTFAAADVFFPEFKLVVQLDGCCHMNGNVHGGKLAKNDRYQARDRHFNITAMERGYNVLRFHHADVPDAEFVLAEAFSHCLHSDGKARLMYSPQYPKHLHMSVGEAHLVIDLGIE